MTDCKHDWRFQYVCYWKHYKSEGDAYPTTSIRDKYYCTKCLDVDYSLSRKYPVEPSKDFVYELPI